MQVEIWNLDEIKPYELNSKKHDERQVAGIANSIERFGWDQPIVVDKDGVIIKGHGRRLAAIKLKLERVPVLIRSDLTEEQVKAARIADNRTAIGDIDTELLRMDLEAINIDDLRGIFEDKELDFINADMTEMNMDVFIDDLDGALAAKAQETEEKFEEIAKKRVSLSKAFGFKDIVGSDQIHITHFMAKVEDLTGKENDEALITFIKQLLEESK